MKAPKCRSCGKEHWGRICPTFKIDSPKTTKFKKLPKLPQAAIIPILEDVANHLADKAHLRREARAGKLLPEPPKSNPEDGVAFGFDRAAYQRKYMREYMRKQRAAAKESRT